MQVNRWMDTLCALGFDVDHGHAGLMRGPKLRSAMVPVGLPVDAVFLVLTVAPCAQSQQQPTRSAALMMS
jgi:hypothetical protein